MSLFFTRSLAILVATAALGGCASPRSIPIGGLEIESWRTRGQVDDDETERERQPPAQAVVLDNGLTVIVAPQSGRSFVSVRYALQTGSDSDPLGLEGLASLAYRWLVDFEVDPVSGRLEDRPTGIGDELSYDVQRDGAVFGLNVEREHLERAVEILAGRILHPTLRPELFQHLKERRLEALEEAKPPLCSPLAAMRAASYGVGAVRPLRGSAASVAAIEQEDALSFYRANVRPNLSALIFAGDLSKEEAVALAEKWFGIPRDPGERAPPLLGAASEPSRRIRVYYRPGGSGGQATISVGLPYLPREHPEWRALEFAASSLSGRFGHTLREELGVTYGMRSSTYASTVAPYRLWTGQVQEDAIGEALRALFKEADGIGRYVDWEPNFERRQKNWLTYGGSWTEHPASIAGTNVHLYLSGRPVDARDLDIEEVRKLRHAKVKEARKRYLRPELLQIMLEGDPEVIEAQVASLGLGTLTKLEGCDDDDTEEEERLTESAATRWEGPQTRDSRR